MAKFIGKCPICQQGLKVRKLLVYCPGGDYKAKRQEFDETWERYREFAITSLKGAEMLMDALVKLNAAG